MQTIAIQPRDELSAPIPSGKTKPYQNTRRSGFLFHSVFSQLREARARLTIHRMVAAALAAAICFPVLAQENWESVDAGKALLKFENAKRYTLLQSKDWKKTLEQSEWTLDDGSTVYFHVTRMGSGWLLVKGGETLQDLFQRVFPNAELVEVGEPFINRDRGTRGQAQWLRYRSLGNHCVLIRQYGWDDDTDITGRVPMGNRVAIGYRCAGTELSQAEIKDLIERIDF